MNNGVYGKLNLIRYYLLKFKSLDEICDATKLSKDEIIKYIEEICKVDNTNILVNTNREEPKIEYKKRKDKIHILENNTNNKYKVTLMIVSDKHIDHVDDKLECIDNLYEEAEKRNIDYVLDLGDILNGPSEMVHNPNKVKTGTLEGCIKQLVDFHPNNIPTYFITGNHDIKFMNTNMCDIGRLIEQKCSYMKFMGNLFSTIRIYGLNINLSHGSIENKMISQVNLKKEFPILTQNKPNIILQGHFHVSAEPIIKNNILLCQVPCLKASDTFLTDKTMGALFLTIYNSKKEFDIIYEEIEFSNSKKILKKEINIEKQRQVV